MTNLGAFIALAAFLALIPGPDTTVVTRNTLVGSRSAGLATVVGVASGLTVWSFAAGLGVAAVIKASAPAFDALKIAGAVYLAALGIQALWAAARHTGSRAQAQVERRTLSQHVAFRQGLLTNLGNPKIAIFFTSFLPQFTTGPHPSFGVLIALALIFSLIGLTVLTSYCLLAARVSSFLRRSGPRRVLEAVTGVVFIGFGVRLVAEHR
jgi:threonine/homoserine/homoserine lactone efflux protein